MIRTTLRPAILALLASAAFAASAQTTLGNPAAPVSIVAFIDLECPFSAETVPHLEAYVQAHPDQVRLQLRQFPLEQHVESRLAHEAALAAGAQGKYLQMVDLIQANQRTMTRDQYLHYAEALHLDLPRFTHDLDTHRFLPQVIDEVNEGNALGVTATPTLYINGKQVSGGQTAVELSSLIQQADYIHKVDAPPTVATEASAPIVSPDLWKQMLTDATQTLGPSDAPVTVVEFTDFQCPFCRRSVQPLHDLIAASGGKIRWVYRSFPLDIHENSQIAAEAALAAGAQGKFWPMHDLLFAQQDSLDRAHLDGFARQIGLDLPRFQADLASGRFRASIASDRVLGNKAGVDGTPAFFINGHFLSGARSLPELQQAVALATQQPGSAVPTTQLAATLPPPEHLIAGTFNAPNTILWFSDVEAAAAPAIGKIVQQLLAQQGSQKENQLRVVLKSYALPDHPAAALTHRALLAAAGQQKFWTFYYLLAGKTLPLDAIAAQAVMQAAAVQAGLNPEAFQRALTDPTLTPDIEADHLEATHRGIRGVPVLFLNEKRVDGIQSLDLYQKYLAPEQASLHISK